MGEGGEEPLHAVEALPEVLVGAAAGQADVAFQAEAASGYGGNAGLPDHPGAELVAPHSTG